MVKRKAPDGDEIKGDVTGPIPLQSFLWQQTR